MIEPYNFIINQGATWEWSLEDFSFSLDGAVFTMEIRESPNRTSDLLFSVTPYLTIESGRLLATVPDTVTYDFSFTKGFYDLFVEVDGTKTKLLSGSVDVVEQITDVSA